MKNILKFLIRCYQLSVSPDHGLFKIFFPHGYCQFYPSCSEYAYKAIDQHGLYGLWLGFLRVLRCNPWSKGGIDKV